MLSSIIARMVAWWSVKNPRSASAVGDLGTQLAPGQRASTVGSRCLTMSACMISRPDTPKRSLTTS